MSQVLEPELLQTFVAIVDSGSFTRAAQRVCRTQSAVSMQMKRLEEMIGRPLVDRAVHKVLLTPDGELLLGHARRILHAHQQALAAFGTSPVSDTVVVGCPDDYVQNLLPPILSWFAEHHPRLQVDIVCEPTVRLLKLLPAGSVDVALVTHGYGDYSGIVIHEDPLVWVTSMQGHAHEQDPLPLALYHPPRCPFRLAALEALTTHGRASRVVYTTESIAGIGAAVGSGLAVSVLAKHTVPAGLRVLSEADGFPPLPNVTIALRRAAGKTSQALDHLEQHVSHRSSGGGRRPGQRREPETVKRSTQGGTKSQVGSGETAGADDGAKPAAHGLSKALKGDRRGVQRQEGSVDDRENLRASPALCR